MKKIGRGKERITSSSKKEEVEGIVVRKGPWTMEEDFILFNYILNHGEGLWNSVAKASGLKRTGKSCRLRWLNYLRPDVRRGNITSEEQILIIQLHSKLGNSWSKIAKHLPGRTDNEIKNFWRTKIQRHIKTTSSVSNNNNNNKNDYCSTKKVEKGSCSKGSVEMEQQQQHSSNDFDNYHWNVEDLWPLHLLNSHHHQQQPLL